MKNIAFDFLLHPTFSLRAWLCLRLVTAATPLYCRLMRHHKPVWSYSLPTLCTFPAGTLGRDLGNFLRTNGLRLQPHAEEHDVFHVLLGFEPTVIGEARMQFALLGNGRHSVFVWASVLLGLVLFPEYYPIFRQDYRDGQKCRPFSRWHFQHLLHQNTEELRDFIFYRHGSW